MAHFRHTEPHIADIEAQIRWEMEGVRRGVEIVREAADKAAFGDTQTGMHLISYAAPRLIEQIKLAQAEATAGLTSGKRGAPVYWWWMVVLLEAEKLAVITLKAVLSQKSRDFTFNVPVTGAAGAIARQVQVQIDYEEWQADEKAKAKDAKARGDYDHVDQHARFLFSTKQIDAKAFAKFSARIKRERREKWTNEVCIAYGTKLIQLLCAAVPDWFTLEEHRLKGGRQEKQLCFSEACKEVIWDITQRNELSRPLLLPMTCPPAPWRKAA